MNNNFNSKPKKKEFNYLDIIANCPNYIGRNYAVSNEILYQNSFVTEDKQLRIEVCKKFLRSSQHVVMMNLVTFYDNNFNPYKIEFQEKLKEDPKYKGIIYSFDFVQNAEDKNEDRMLELINRMRIVNENPKNNYMLIPLKSYKDDYNNTLIDFKLINQNPNFQYLNAPFYPINFVQMHISKFGSNKRLNVQKPAQYKYRNFEQELDFYFTEYEFYWKFLNMLAQAYNAQG